MLSHPPLIPLIPLISLLPLSLHPVFSVLYPPAWEKLARKELGGEIGPQDLEWITPEGIKLKPLYTGEVTAIIHCHHSLSDIAFRQVKSLSSFTVRYCC